MGWLVGGWTNPIWKNKTKWVHLPQVGISRDENEKKSIQHLEKRLELFMFFSMEMVSSFFVLFFALPEPSIAAMSVLLM